MSNTECCNQNCNQGRDCPLRQRDCQRSNPHEQMNQMCELRTEIARLTNKLARAEAQLAAVQQGVPALNVSQETIDFLKESMEDCDDSARDVAISHDIEKILIAATHPTQQGLDALRKALEDLERACDKRASLTSPEVYLSLAVLPGMSVALLELDVARAQARAAIAAQAKQGGV